MGVARSLYRRLLLYIVIVNCPVMALSTIFTQYAPEITAFDKISQNKGISPFILYSLLLTNRLLGS